MSEERAVTTVRNAVVFATAMFGVAFALGLVVGNFHLSDEADRRAAPSVQRVECEPVPQDGDGSCSLHDQRQGFMYCLTQCTEARRSLIGWEIDQRGPSCRCSPVVDQ